VHRERDLGYAVAIEVDLPGSKSKRSFGVQRYAQKEAVSPVFQQGVVQVGRWTTAFSSYRENRAVR
jgi:hypothetical protein